MDIINLKIEDLQPYEHNARHHEEKDLEAIEASIREFGFNDPIGIWGEKNIIVEGHGRLIAAKNIGLQEVPCIRLDHLTDEQRRAYALAHNKTAELSRWDFDVLDAELAGIEELDMSAFGFINTDWFDREQKDGNARQEGNDEYNAFLDKFDAKKTTDDCYTPKNIYDAVADWVEREYGVKRECFVRPFYPGGDYEAEKYKATDVVVDNPPFSILSKIVKFYDEHDVRFFLFAPTLTLFSSNAATSVCAICCGVDITYENGAMVNTSFLTNLERSRLRTAPELYQIVKAEDDKNRAEMTAELPNYEYPDEVVTATKVAWYCKYGIDFKVSREESVRIRALDSQKEKGKAIFGAGFLISKKAAAEKAAAEKAAAEKAAAEKWELSEREKQIVSHL